MRNKGVLRVYLPKPVKSQSVYVLAAKQSSARLSRVQFGLGGTIYQGSQASSAFCDAQKSYVSSKQTER